MLQVPFQMFTSIHLSYLIVHLTEPLVFQDTCALSTDAQSHLMVHRYTHRHRLAHYDKI